MPCRVSSASELLTRNHQTSDCNPLSRKQPSECSTGFCSLFRIILAKKDSSARAQCIAGAQSRSASWKLLGSFLVVPSTWSPGRFPPKKSVCIKSGVNKERGLMKLHRSAGRLRSSSCYSQLGRALCRAHNATVKSSDDD